MCTWVFVCAKYSTVQYYQSAGFFVCLYLAFNAAIQAAVTAVTKDVPSLSGSINSRLRFTLLIAK